MGMPLRILKFAMDFFARVITAFCPVIWPSSTAAVSSSFAFWLASPRPMLTVIFCSFGTAIMFFQPKRFMSAGTVSVRYFSCNRLFIAFFYLVLYLSNAVLQCRQLRTFVPSGSTVWPIRVCLPQLPQNDHHVRDVNPRFLLDDSALDVLRRVGTRVPLDDADVLDHHGVFSSR